jgi:hypothetical protein
MFWICLYLVIWICIFFNIYFEFVFRFVNFVSKSPKIIIIIFFEKKKTCPKVGPKLLQSKLKSSFQTTDYKHNNR